MVAALLGQVCVSYIMIGSYARFQIELCCTFWTNLTFSRQSCRIINTSCRAQGPSQCGELWHPRKYHNTLSQGGVRSTEVAWCALFPMFAGRCGFCLGAPPYLVHKYFRHAKTLFPGLGFSPLAVSCSNTLRFRPSQTSRR